MFLAGYISCELGAFATTLFGVSPFLPTPDGLRMQQLKTRSEYWIQGLHEASTQACARFLQATTNRLGKGAQAIEGCGLGSAGRASLGRPIKLSSLVQPGSARTGQGLTLS